MNYAELQSAIVAETENTDTSFAASIPTFVRNAEKRIYQAVKLPSMRKNAVSAIGASSSSYVALPADFLAPWEFAVIDGDGNYQYLLLKDVSFLREMYPSPTAVGFPKYYAVFDNDTFQVAPTPAANYSTELHYFGYPESIVTASTSWLADNFDNVLLYGALVEAAAFMKSEADIVKTYSEQYAVNLKLLLEYANGKLRSSNYR